MKNNTKEQVHSLICKYTIQFSTTKALLGSAIRIAEEVYASRSLVSLYLNELFKEGLLIKINTRPVYYLDKKTLSKIFNIYIPDSTFDFLDDLTDLIDERLLDQGSFIQAVGHNGSLSYCIHQMQSAVKYPVNALPILLLGNHGCGKSFLASLLAQFCVDEGLTDKSQIIFFSSVYDQKLSVFESLFGYQNRTNQTWVPGLIEQCANGLLILKDIQNYDKVTLSFLSEYFKNGFYTIGPKREKHLSSVRILMTAAPDKMISSSLAKELPVVCRIPDFHERPIAEREQIISRLFLAEQKKICKKIYLSKAVFHSLVSHKYSSNFKELQAIIKSLCVASYQPDGDSISIQAWQLPDTLLSFSSDQQEACSDALISVDELRSEYYPDSVYVYFDLLLSLYDRLKEGSSALFINECKDRLNDYYDYLAANRNGINSRASAYEKVLNSIADEFFNQYQILLPASCICVLSQIAYCLAYDNRQINEWNRQNSEKILSLKTYFEKICPRSYSYAELFSAQIKERLSIDFDIANKIFIFLNIYFSNQKLNELNYDCIILAHGRSTASSIADAVNKMTETRIFIGIDMPIDISFEETVSKVKECLKRLGTNKDLIILIDMGSLEGLNSALLGLSNVNIGIVDNVNTRLALDVAAKIFAGCSMEEIVKTAAQENVCSYTLHVMSKKRAAIVFTNETGETATERVIQLLKKSIPKTVDISILSCSYENLLLDKQNAVIFENYNVILLIGLTEIEDLCIPFISLEEIIAFSDFDLLKEAFAHYMEAEEMASFEKNLIRNFSLANILDNITILNASKLYEQMQQSLAMLENYYQIIIPNKIKVGLYIHFSCLTERLVLDSKKELPPKKEASDNPDIRRFINVFRLCFQGIQDYYKIHFPNHEILYLYEHLRPLMPL